MEIICNAHFSVICVCSELCEAKIQVKVLRTVYCNVAFGELIWMLCGHVNLVQYKQHARLC